MAIAFANRGKRVCAVDIDRAAGDRIARGTMPFLDEGADEALARALTSGNLTLSVNPSDVSDADAVIIVVGTPVDRYLNPEFEAMRDVLASYLEFMRDGQLIVLR